MTAQRHGMRLFGEDRSVRIHPKQQDANLFGDTAAATHLSHRRPRGRPTALSVGNRKALLEARTPAATSTLTAPNAPLPKVQRYWISRPPKYLSECAPSSIDPDT